jgi:hypothetical protein
MYSSLYVVPWANTEVAAKSDSTMNQIHLEVLDVSAFFLTILLAIVRYLQFCENVYRLFIEKILPLYDYVPYIPAVLKLVANSAIIP